MQKCPRMARWDPAGFEPSADTPRRCIMKGDLTRCLSCSQSHLGRLCTCWLLSPCAPATRVHTQGEALSHPFSWLFLDPGAGTVLYVQGASCRQMPDACCGTDEEILERIWRTRVAPSRVRPSQPGLGFPKAWTSLIRRLCLKAFGVDPVSRTPWFPPTIRTRSFHVLLKPLSSSRAAISH